MIAIDFTRSLPPVPDILGPALRRAWRSADDLDLASVGRTSSAAGLPDHRLAGAQWLAPRFGQTIDPDRILITNGTQSAIIQLMQHFISPGKCLVAECLSYGVLRALGKIAGVAIKGLPIDKDGLDPAALADMCRSNQVGAIYCNPTFHNPTAAVMSISRRLAIADVARQYRVPIIEDDPIGLLYPDFPPPIAALAPEVTWFVCGLTKTISQGMRIAYMVAPDPDARNTLLQPIARLSHWVPAPLMATVATQLLNGGEGVQVARAIAAENITREEFARTLLPSRDSQPFPGSPHLWLSMPPDAAIEFETKAAAAGVLVRSHEMFRVDDGPVPTGIRLSLSSLLDRSVVADGLRRLASILEEMSIAS